MFTEQQKDDMRNVFGFIYEQEQTMNIARLARKFNMTIEKMFALINTMSSCKYVMYSFTDNQPIYAYDVEAHDFGIERYEAFLALNK